MRVCAILLLLFIAAPGAADEPVRVAVASNFITTFEELAERFEEATGIRAIPHRGSTGHLYAQIVNGAPVDVFLAADAKRPEALVDAGFGVEGSRFTYAVGRLVVWSASIPDCVDALHDPSSGRVSLANPELAPYGNAAKEFLQAIDAWDPDRNVLGANVVQAFSFTATGNAPIGIISRAQAGLVTPAQSACLHDVPSTMHRPIEQQAVLLDGQNHRAQQFIEFLRSADAQSIIKNDGYEVPQ